MADIPIPGPLKSLGRIWAKEGLPLYGVGGIVRNALLFVPYRDLDICSAMLPERVVALCAEQGIRTMPKALLFGTVEIHFEGLCFEHTTFRGGEEYPEGGKHRPDRVRLGVGLTEDAHRRDFSCNAVYVDVMSGAIEDPTGGVADIACRRLRSTTKDPSVILRDDGLRVMRLVRFCAELGFTPEEDTFAAAAACVGGLQDIAWERKQAELTKILLADARYPSLQPKGRSAVFYGLSLLFKLGILPYVLPELLEGELIAQRPQYHRYVVMEHNFHACAFAPPTLTMRLAALLHDVGKPAALREKGLPKNAGGYDAPPPALCLPKGQTPMLGHDRIGADMAKAMLLRLRYPNALVDEVAALIANHMYDLNGKAKESTLRARFASWGYDHVERLCALREADVRGSGYALGFEATRWRDVLGKMRREGAPFSEAALNCTGEDIMRWRGLAPGPAVGEIKRRLLLHCARHPADNTKERLEKIARGI